MGRKSRHSKEIKIKACKDYEEGNGSFNSISEMIRVNKSTVLRWYRKYKEYGPEIFETSDRNKSYTKEFKMLIIQEYMTGKGSTRGLAVKYNISSGTVSSWVNKRYNGYLSPHLSLTAIKLSIAISSFLVLFLLLDSCQKGVFYFIHTQNILQSQMNIQQGDMMCFNVYLKLYLSFFNYVIMKARVYNISTHNISNLSLPLYHHYTTKPPRIKSPRVLRLNYSPFTVAITFSPAFSSFPPKSLTK